MDEKINLFIEEAEASSTFAGLRPACITFFTSIGGKMVSYHHMPPFGAADHSGELTVVAHGFPEEWVTR